MKENMHKYSKQLEIQKNSKKTIIHDRNYKKTTRQLQEIHEHHQKTKRKQQEIQENQKKNIIRKLQEHTGKPLQEIQENHQTSIENTRKQPKHDRNNKKTKRKR